ncbi:MAG TPA: FHA domain-containing protein [Verrucomicrobiales bacterium]|jgi:hypothetical protein|nr:FHA domain-containing protein [Verrucomicrobiales bacterium]
MPRFVDIASGHALDLAEEPMTFGSAKDNTVPIVGPFDLHPHHFKLIPVSDGLLLQDLTGQHGLTVNDLPVTQTYLHHGDVVAAGRLRLRYDAPSEPPPLPPEAPVPLIAANLPSLSTAPLAVGYGAPGAEINHFTLKAPKPRDDYKDGGKTFLPNAATAVHVFKWVLPVLGLIIWLAKWGYTYYQVKDDTDRSEAIATAHVLVETYRDARAAKAPLIQNVRDAVRIVRLLVRGVHGSGAEASHEFKIDLPPDRIGEALDMLTYEEKSGLTFKPEYREERAKANKTELESMDPGPSEPEETPAADPPDPSEPTESA